MPRASSQSVPDLLKNSFCKTLNRANRSFERFALFSVFIYLIFVLFSLFSCLRFRYTVVNCGAGYNNCFRIRF